MNRCIRAYRFVALLIIVLGMLIPVSAKSHNEQIGIVKTRGKLSQNGQVAPGTPIDGAAVVIKGGNSTVSDSTGGFSIALQQGKFYIDNVKKNGYEIIDAELLKKEYYVSKNPLVIVMETPDAILKDKLMIERKIRKALQEQLQSKEEELERLMNENKLTNAEYMQALQKLYEVQERNEGLISEMAARYSAMDFDQVDRFNAMISDCILNGRLVEADSLLNTKGDIKERISELRQYQEANAKEEARLIERREKLQKSKQMVRETMDELLLDCYSKFEINQLRHETDSAAFYIKLRADIDTTDVMLQHEAGMYVSRYLADYDGALELYFRGLRQAVKQYGESSENVAMFYTDVANAMDDIGDYDNAMSYYNKALEIRKEIYELPHPDIAGSYHNIAGIHFVYEEYDKALELNFLALDIFLDYYGYNHKDTFETYHNIGHIYTILEDFDKALKYTKTALDIVVEAYGEEHPDVAVCYNSLGCIYEDMDDYTSSMDSYMKALSIGKLALGEIHPDIALYYNNLGYLYSVQGDKNTALEYYTKSVELNEKVYGSSHPQLAGALHNIGRLYSNLDDIDAAYKNLNRALQIYLTVFGENHVSTSRCYDALGELALMQKDFDVAIKYYTDALNTRIAVLGDSHSSVANSLNNIGSVYSRKGDYSNAISYYQRSLDIMSQLVPDNHPIITLITKNIAHCQKHL